AEDTATSFRSDANALATRPRDGRANGREEFNRRGSLFWSSATMARREHRPGARHRLQPQTANSGRSGPSQRTGFHSFYTGGPKREAGSGRGSGGLPPL